MCSLLTRVRPPGLLVDECNGLVSTIALLTQEIAHQVCCVRDNSKLLKDAQRFHQYPVLDDLALHNAVARWLASLEARTWLR